MGRNGQLIRQWRILIRLCLNHFGRSFMELAEEFSVSTRTIRRDLECLEQAGFPVYSELDDGQVRWKVRKEKHCEKIIALKGMPRDK